MTINITAKKITVNEDFTAKAEKKLSKLDKFFEDASATVNLLPVQNDITVELTVKSSDMIFRSVKTGKDKLVLLDECIDTIIRKIRRNKTKLRKQLHSALPEFDDYEEEDSEHVVVKRKTFDFKPMTSDEAILQMEMLGHNFFVYRDGDTNDVCVVYKRSNGGYGVIESE